MRTTCRGKSVWRNDACENSRTSDRVHHRSRTEHRKGEGKRGQKHLRMAFVMTTNTIIDSLTGHEYTPLASDEVIPETAEHSLCEDGKQSIY